MKPTPAVPVTLLIFVIVSAFLVLAWVLKSEIGRAVLGISACLMVLLTIWAARAPKVER